MSIRSYLGLHPLQWCLLSCAGEKVSDIPFRLSTDAICGCLYIFSWMSVICFVFSFRETRYTWARVVSWRYVWGIIRKRNSCVTVRVYGSNRNSIPRCLLCGLRYFGFNPPPKRRWENSSPLAYIFSGLCKTCFRNGVLAIECVHLVGVWRNAGESQYLAKW